MVPPTEEKSSAERDHSSSAYMKHVITNLLLATDKHETRAAVMAAVEEFCHDEVEKHDEEIVAGAPNALYKTFVLCTANFDMYREIVGGVCKCLRYMFICSNKVAYETYQSGVGRELLSALTEGAEKCLDGTWKDPGHVILEHSLAAVVNICYVPSITLGMETKFGLGDLCASAFIEFDYYDVKAIASTMMTDISTSRRFDKTVLVGERSEILEIMIECCDSFSFKVREIAAKGLWQFSTRKHHKDCLASNHFVRKALIHLLQDAHSGSRAYAAGTLFELAHGCDHTNKVNLAKHANGALLECLANVMKDDLDKNAKLYAARAIKHMISDETTKLIANHSVLMNTVTTIAEENDEDGAVKKEVLKILKKLVSSSN
mmetsp:Transcript_15080/g.22256  ORF Transcript_15080/g.22256 Transcript_15080/m.22256 type:complete len:375 (-) Transcript_15080:155-1279(-)